MCPAGHQHSKKCGEMVDFGESDKMIKISGQVDKSNTYNGFSDNISFFIHGRVWRSSSVNAINWFYSYKWKYSLRWIERERVVE